MLYEHATEPMLKHGCIFRCNDDIATSGSSHNSSWRSCQETNDDETAAVMFSKAEIRAKFENLQLEAEAQRSNVPVNKKRVLLLF